MTKYLMYTLDEAGRIGLPEEIVAKSDEQALAKIQAMNLRYRRCEIWHDHRLVAALDGGGSAARGGNPGLATALEG